MANQDVLVQLINERFGDVLRRLDVMDAKNDQRDLRVNTMDAANKKEVADLRADIEAAKTAWRVITGILAVVTGFVGWAVSMVPDFWTAFHRS
jgi:hypothetical protein